MPWGDPKPEFQDIVAVLDFEWENLGTDARKASRIRSRFNVTEARYYQHLFRVIKTEAAVKHNPILVRSLLDRAEAASRRRAARLAQGYR